MRYIFTVQWSKTISEEATSTTFLVMLYKSCPKRIGPVQNNLYPTKMIWTVQNHFGPIEGQGISVANQFKINPQLMSHDFAKLKVS